MNIRKIAPLMIGVWVITAPILAQEANDENPFAPRAKVEATKKKEPNRQHRVLLETLPREDTVITLSSPLPEGWTFDNKKNPTAIYTEVVNGKAKLKIIFDADGMRLIDDPPVSYEEANNIPKLSTKRSIQFFEPEGKFKMSLDGVASQGKYIYELTESEEIATFIRYAPKLEYKPTLYKDNRPSFGYVKEKPIHWYLKSPGVTNIATAAKWLDLFARAKYGDLYNKRAQQIEIAKKGVRLSQEPPAGYTLVSTETIPFTYEDQKTRATVKNYQNDKGERRSCYIVGSDFAWAETPIIEDRYTGEKKFDPNASARNIMVYSWIKVRPFSVVCCQSRFYNSLGRNLLYYGTPEGLGGLAFGANVSMEDWTAVHTHQDYLNEIASRAPKGTSFYKKSQKENAEIRSNIGVPIFTLNGKVLDMNYNPSKMAYTTRDGRISYQLGGDKELRKFINYESRSGDGRSFQIPLFDDLKDIVETERSIKLYFNENDSIQFLKGSHEIFDSYISRPGYWDIEFGRDKKGKVYFNRDLKVRGRYYVEANVKKGSKYVGIMEPEAIFVMQSSDISTTLTRTGSIINPDGQVDFNIFRHEISCPRLDEQKKQQEAKEAADRAAQEKAIYNAYCQKYGKQYVDAILKGSLLVGTPAALLKSAYDFNVRSDYGHSQVLRVVMDSPSYRLDTKTISSRGNTHFTYCSINALVTIRGGKVISITKL